MQEQNGPNDKVVLLSHGAGGILQEELIKFVTSSATIRQVGNGIGIDAFDDGATVPLQDSNFEIVMSADGHTIHPLFFPGGDIGLLSAASTINDIAMMGAKCIAISSTIFVEEGFSFSKLKKIMDSFNSALGTHGVALICGDTKVIPKGQLDQLMMSTTGIGLRPKNRYIADNNVKPGDFIIVTGPLGDHEAALIANRHGIDLKTNLTSDVAILLDMIKKLGDFEGIHAMKDPTRGGLASALNQWAYHSKVGINLTEKDIPIRTEVRSICDILGLNPYHLASEGKALLAVDAEHSQTILDILKSHELGKYAKIVGVAQEQNSGIVLLNSEYGGHKFLENPYGENIPRVC
jgi:hydrogenase expression/formation protein HypE